MLSNDIMLKLLQCKLANISLGWVIDEAALLPLPMWFLRSNSRLACTKKNKSWNFA